MDLWRSAITGPQTLDSGINLFCNYPFAKEEVPCKIEVTLHQEHRAGEKVFVDYASQTVPVIDGPTGEIRKASIFVADLSASNYTYVWPPVASTLPTTAHLVRFFIPVLQKGLSR